MKSQPIAVKSQPIADGAVGGSLTRVTQPLTHNTLQPAQLSVVVVKVIDRRLRAVAPKLGAHDGATRAGPVRYAPYGHDRGDDHDGAIPAGGAKVDASLAVICG